MKLVTYAVVMRMKDRRCQQQLPWARSVQSDNWQAPRANPRV